MLEPLPRHLSDAIDPLSRPGTWKSKRATLRLIREFHPFAKIKGKILGILNEAPYYISKPQLELKMWRYPARPLNRTLSRMIMDDRITLYAGYLFPLSHAGFAECVQLVIEAAMKG